MAADFVAAHSNALNEEMDCSSEHPLEDALAWLCSTYEIAEGEKLLRASVYTDYEAYCQHTGKTPVDRSVLGKLLRKAFPNIQMRRLGPRNGNHYYYLSLRQKRNKSSESASQPSSFTPTRDTTLPLPETMLVGQPSLWASESMSIDQNRVYFATLALPKLKLCVSNNINEQAANEFAEDYHRHCQLLANAFSDLEFGNALQKSCSFWDSISASTAELLTYPDIVNQLIHYDEVIFSALASHLINIVRQPHATTYAIYVVLKTVVTNFDKLVLVSMRAAPYDFISKRTAVIQRVFVEPIAKEFH